jgi:peptidoglycan-associated lipoprotein
MKTARRIRHPVAERRNAQPAMQGGMDAAWSRSARSLRRPTRPAERRRSGLVAGDAAPTTTFKNPDPATTVTVLPDACRQVRGSARRSSASRRWHRRRRDPGRGAAGRPVGEPRREAGKYLKDVFFDFDKSEIRADQKDAVAADAQWLREHTTVGVTVEGHCDERGTREYNLALGERRANAVREALVALGVDPAQIKTISYGKERPFCTEHPKEKPAQEECWQLNRRGHFVPAIR